MKLSSKLPQVTCLLVLKCLLECAVARGETPARDSRAPARFPARQNGNQPLRSWEALKTGPRPGQENPGQPGPRCHAVEGGVLPASLPAGRVESTNALPINPPATAGPAMRTGPTVTTVPIQPAGPAIIPGAICVRVGGRHAPLAADCMPGVKSTDTLMPAKLEKVGDLKNRPDIKNAGGEQRAHAKMGNRREKFDASIPKAVASNGKISARIGEHDSVNCAPVGAFGFLTVRPGAGTSTRFVSSMKGAEAAVGDASLTRLRTEHRGASVTNLPTPLLDGNLASSSAGTIPIVKKRSRMRGLGDMAGTGAPGNARMPPVDASVSVTVTDVSLDKVAVGNPAGSLPSATSSRISATSTVSAPLEVAPVPSGARLLAFAAPENISLDDSLGQTGQPAYAGGDYLIDAGLGKTVDQNVFFSFAQFRLDSGESATFVGSSGIRNILARVTGGSVSDIDGTINVDIDGANLFLMNPAGFVFGQNAQINVTGSFAVTTADYLKLADGTRFTALPGPEDASLSAASVSAFGFLPGRLNPPGEVIISDASIELPEGANFLAVAGNQSIQNSFLVVPSGRILLASVVGPGEFSLDSVTQDAAGLAPALGTVNITDGSFVSSGAFGTNLPGRVEIYGADVNILESMVDASMIENPDGALGGSSIFVRADRLLVRASQIGAEASGFGLAGLIDIRAREMLMTSRSQIQSISYDDVSGGRVSVDTTTLQMLVSSISTSTRGSGAAGNVDVKADSISITGGAESTASVAGILAESGSVDRQGKIATGRGGDIHVTARQLTLAAGGQVSATTFGPGEGGDVFVTAGDIQISGYSVSPTLGLSQSGILARAALVGSGGRGGAGGNVNISVDTLHIGGDGLITASTLGSGDGGSVALHAKSIVLDGSGSTLPSGITATTSYAIGGHGGDISIVADSLSLLGGAEVSAATMGSGAGGSISVAARDLFISGRDSMITAQTLAQFGGAGGNVQLNTGSITVVDGGQISASTKGSGQGGAIDINASQIVLNSGGAIRADSSGVDGVANLDPMIESLSLTLNITTAVGGNSNIRVNLTNPAGSAVVVFSGGQASGTDFVDTVFNDSGAVPITGGTAPYTGIFQPVEPFDLLAGGVTNGTWNLNVSNFIEDASLNAWTLTVNGRQFSGTPQALPEPSFVNIPIEINLPGIPQLVKAGAGGSIQINTGSIEVRDGGTVTAVTSGDGAAGSLRIRANSVTIDAAGAGADTGFFASALPGSTGSGGNVSVDAHQLRLTGSSKSSFAGGIVARSANAASAGSITLRADDISLDGRAQISSANIGTGAAGSVDLRAENSAVLRNGSVITVVSQNANAGTISIVAGDTIELRDKSTVTASAGASGGSIVLTATERLLLDRSSIVATAGGGNGGNITIDPIFIILNQGLISANALGGAGGNILIEGRYFFANNTPISATGTTDGTVQITTLPLDIVNALAALQGGFIDLSSSLQESCTLRLGLDNSSFLVIGRGGVEDSPDEPRTSRPNRKSKAGAR